MKKLFFFLAAMVLSIAAQAAVVNIDPSSEGNLRRGIRDKVQDGDTLVLADGEYEESQSVTLDKKGLVIMAADGAKPVIKASSYMKHYATTTVIGITFDGGGTAEHGFYSYENTNKSLTLIDCEIGNYAQYLINASTSAHIDSLIIEGCLLHDCGDAAVYMTNTDALPDNLPICSYFKMTNSTIYNINGEQYYGAIDIRENKSAYGAGGTEVIVDHVTLYNYKNPQGGFYIYKSPKLTITNTIVANPTEGPAAFYIYGGTVDNSLYFNGSADSRGTYKECIDGQDPLFMDPTNGNFNLQPGSPVIGKATDGTNMGDPRWKVAAAELSFAMAAPAADVEATDLYTIKWNVLDPAGDATIKLEYKTEEGEWTLIEENIPTTKSAYDWNIRKMAAQTVAIRGTLTNATETIESVATGKLTIVPEAVAPRPVRNLAGEVAENTLTLTWVNPDQAYEVSETLETLESAESYISNDGTAEVTLSGDKKEVSVAYNTTVAWHMAGVKVPVTADYVNTLACELKRDAADGTQIQVTIEQNGFDWWYLIIDDIPTEWTKYEFTEFEKLSWHNNSEAAVLDGTNVTAVYFATNHGSGVTGTLSLRNLTLNGAVPAVADYAKTVVCASTTDYPAAIVASEVVYEGTASTCALTIDPTEDYYVSVFAQDDLGNTSVAAQYMYEAPEVVEPEKPEPTYTENNLNPYAFGLESELVEGALNVTYRLNNSNATSVNVVVYNGEEVVATVAGTTTIGKNTVEVPTADLPGGVELTWGVEVNGTSVEVPTQETKMYNMYCPHGLAIDKDPESEYFGRILVADAMNIVKDKANYLGSGKGAGLYVFNPSFTTDSVVYKGGNDFTRVWASNGYQPWRVKISEDGRIFVSSLDLNGVVVWEVSKDLQTWTPVIAGTQGANGNILDAEGNFVAGMNVSMDVVGSGENLKLLLYSCTTSASAFSQSAFRLDEYALGTATTWTGTPKNILTGGKYALVHTNAEWIYDGEGGYWFGGSRAGNAGEPNLVHINAAGEQDYYTEDASLYGGDGVLVHNGMLFKGKSRTSGTVGNFGVWTIGKDADGKVTLTEKWSVVANGIGRNLNEFAVDYAENLYVVGNSGEKIIAYALPYSGKVETPAAAKYAFQLEAPVVDPVELVGVVKRALTIGESTVVLTHEADGTPHIYNIVGEEIAEISLEGVVPVDPENKGSYLAISDIAATEDGKLVANNYVRNQFAGTTPEAGYKLGTSYYYIWNDLAGAPAVWFTSQTTARSSHGDVGVTFALKGTSTNAQLLVTAVHNNNRAVRLAKYNIIDGQYVEPNIPGGQQSSEYYEYFGTHTKEAYYQEAVQGKQFQLNVSPLGEGRWIMDGELVNPSEFVLPAVGENYEASATLTEDLGKKYNGASYVTVGEKVLMVAPFANPDGQLVGAEILDITKGLDAPQYVDMVYVDEAVAATAAATAVAVADNVLTITLVADATLHVLEVELEKGPATALDNVAVEAKAIKMIKNGQLIIIKNGVQYNVQGQVIK